MFVTTFHTCSSKRPIAINIMVNTQRKLLITFYVYKGLGTSFTEVKGVDLMRKLTV